MGKTYFVTGAAGFIGSHLVDFLLAKGNKVIGYDNFSTGCEKFISHHQDNPHFKLIQGDVLDFKVLVQSMEGSDFVFHLSANADVRFGTQHPRKDLDQNTIATYNVLEAMRENKIHEIAFSSTGSVYGEATAFPTPEDAPFPCQTSLYGASKLAGEGLISAYCEGFGMKGYIFRFVSILGERYTHGHVYDFVKSLKQNPNHIYILGNGKQKKSYLYIKDCLDAIFCAINFNSNKKLDIYNLGTNEYCMVDDSLNWICEYLNINPLREYAGGERGWIGDNPFIFLDTTKIKNLRWKPKLSIRDSVIKTVKWIKENPWIYERNML